jgi:hypothetical protein
MTVFQSDYCTGTQTEERSFRTVTGYKPDADQSEPMSLTFKRNSFRINRRVFWQLEGMGHLTDNWDEEGSPTPNSKALALANLIAWTMEISGQKIYNSAPGPKGEVMLDIRNGEKSFEIIIYNEQLSKFVKFQNGHRPIAGKFEFDNLAELIQWLNKDSE